MCLARDSNVLAYFDNIWYGSSEKLLFYSVLFEQLQNKIYNINISQ